jgi:hypothetical protein
MMRLTVSCSCNKSPCDARKIAAELIIRIRVYATYKVVLLICHDPRTRTYTMIPEGLASVISTFHCTVTVVTAVDLHITVVEAAA